MGKKLKLPTLLIISENPQIRFWIKKHLDSRFFILNAETESEVWKALFSNLDFVIVDASLEDCDPLNLCLELRKKNQLVPILLITGRLKKTFLDKAHRAGVTDFLSNQLDLDELDAKIEVGLKTATAREKTEGLGAFIKGLPKAVSNSLKHKMVLNDRGLKLLAESKTKGHPVSLLYLRIDNFAQWENPDEIYQSLGKFIQKLLRAKDVLIPSADGRYILLLHNTIPEAGKKVAERLREKINAYPFSAIRKMTVSIAVTSMEASEKGFKKMIDSAVKSLKMNDANLIISLEEEAP